MERPEKIRYTKPITKSELSFRHPEYSYRRWQKVRKLHRMKHPLCERCGGVGEMIHHIKPVNQENVYDTKGGTYGGFLDIRNLMTVCNKCHAIIHKELKKQLKK